MVEKSEFKTTLNIFYRNLCDVLQHYKSIIPILREELDCILNDDIKSLNVCLNKLQIFSMQVKGFEKMIFEAQCKLNISARTLSAMIQQMPEEEHLRFYSLLGQLETTLKEVKFYQEKCGDMIQTKLYTLDKMLSVIAIQKDLTLYRQDATEEPGTLFSKAFETTV